MSHLRNFRIRHTLFMLLIILSLPGCMHDEYEFDKLSDEMEINMGLLTPVAYGSLSLNDIISEFDSSSYIQSNEEGLLYITYQDSLFSFIADELIDIPDQNFPEYFIESDDDFPPYASWGDTVTIQRTEYYEFSFSNNEDPDSIYINTANLNLEINSTFQHTGKLFITSDYIRNDNGPLIDTIIIDNSSGSFSANESLVLNNYVIEFADTTVTDTSFLPLDFKLELYDSGAGVNPGDQVEIILTLTDIDFNAIFGYVGNYELMAETGDLELNFFESLSEGYIEFEDPKVNFHIENSFGLPAEINIERFTGYKNETDSFGLNLEPEINPSNYAFPGIDEYGETKDTTLSIHKDNSNIPEFLAFLPTSLQYNMIATSNPEGPGGAYNFVSKDSRIDVDLEFILPLWFKANEIALEDTMEMDLSNINEDAEIIEKINLVLEVFNGLPVAIDFQIYFLDETYQPVDTLFDPGSQPVIAAGQIDSDYKVTYPTQKVSVVEYLKQDIERLEVVRFATIKAGLKTSGFDNDIAVKFYDYYHVDFNLSIDLDALINTNDL
ncbi:MAG: hypothetical protein V2I54_10415 [Bacteroidales bacterium]|jgi:hypothetical protein|nr:hypothetical protein [Bacteroidales bacterium]